MRKSSRESIIYIRDEPTKLNHCILNLFNTVCVFEFICSCIFYLFLNCTLLHPIRKYVKVILYSYLILKKMNERIIDS